MLGCKTDDDERSINHIPFCWESEKCLWSVLASLRPARYVPVDSIWAWVHMVRACYWLAVLTNKNISEEPLNLSCSAGERTPRIFYLHQIIWSWDKLYSWFDNQFSYDHVWDGIEAPIHFSISKNFIAEIFFTKKMSSWKAAWLLSR